MQKLKGGFTLPGETGMEKIMAELVGKWGVDAVRDSDGTALSQEILDMGLQVYSTLCLVRLDNEYIKQHPEFRQQIYLMSDPVIAETDTLKINIMEHYFDQQFAPNMDVDIHKYWQVIDRTTGEALESFTADKNYIVTIRNTKPYHKYTVSFLAYQIWEPVSMYNHLTNNWTEEHRLPLDVRHPEAQEHVLKILEQWLCDHPKTDVVRFTTFFYNFDLIYNQAGKERQVNWFGYLDCVSQLALEQFANEYGYELTAEDFIDAGKYHTPFENPTSKYLDWMDYNQRFVAEFAKKCVEIVHRYQKKAIMFLGDHWAGTEPYGDYFQSIGLDAVVGAAGDGVTTRMIADIPVKETEARFYPYFFPDVFHEGGDPVGESTAIWSKCRRAMMRKPMQRMGYGGYLSLAYKFPDFIDHVTDIATQFRGILEHSQHTKPYCAPFKVAILNSWGKIRTWQTHQVAHSLWNQRCYSYLGVLEALAGLPFEVEFISFDDIRAGGIAEDVGVIINAGDANTSWSGGEYWKDEKIVTAIREWVYKGGGFIGIGEPTAYDFQGSFFQLADVLGVQKEIGFTASSNKPAIEKAEHFVTQDVSEAIDYGEGMTMIYIANSNAHVLDINNRSCNLVVNSCGLGRAMYMAGAPYNAQNTRILHRGIYWVASKENELKRWFSDNVHVEVTAYPETHSYSVINNSKEVQKSSIYLGDGSIKEISLQPMECKWFEI